MDAPDPAQCPLFDKADVHPTAFKRENNSGVGLGRGEGFDLRALERPFQQLKSETLLQRESTLLKKLNEEMLVNFSRLFFLSNSLSFSVLQGRT